MLRRFWMVVLVAAAGCGSPFGAGGSASGTGPSASGGGSTASETSSTASTSASTSNATSSSAAGTAGSSTSSASSTSGGGCGACQSGQVCCSQGGCAGQCVPDCRLGGGCLDASLTCDTQSGVCVPASSTGASTGPGGPTSGPGGLSGSTGGPGAGSTSGSTSGPGSTSGGPGSTTGPGSTAGSTTGQASSTGTSGGACGTCQSGQVCCSAGGCAGQCVPDCRQGGSCPTNFTCDSQSGVCLPSATTGGSTTGGPAGSTTGSTSTTGPGSTSTTTGAGSTSGPGTTTGSTSGSCGTCQTGDVCCSSGPCAGQCVPDCRLGGSCPNNLVCDSASGVCMPASSTGGSTSGPTTSGPTTGGPGSTTTGGSTTSGGSTTTGGNTTTGGAVCSGDSDCAAPTGACDVPTQTCVECLADADCGTGYACETASDTCWSASCTNSEHTEPSSAVNAKGCHVLLRDTSPCRADRLAQGISGPWLEFSCLVTLTRSVVNGKALIQASSANVPDYKTIYYGSGNACYESYDGRSFPDPYSLSSGSVVMSIEENPTETNGTAVSVPTMGMAVNGVDIFNDSAGQNRSIYDEAGSFDRCGGHPQQSGAYHYHAEPYAITQDDDNLVGVMRDGYFVYGRKDPDGSEAGRPDGGVSAPYYGHVGFTIDSPNVAVFHYHVHYESDDAGNSGYFITPAEFYGVKGACPSGCGSP